MTRYIIKKTLTAIVLVLLVSFLVFILMQFLPVIRRRLHWANPPPQKRFRNIGIHMG